MINLETERVRITAYFQGEVKHQSLPLSLESINLKLPGSKTEITLQLPDKPVHEGFQPLNFSVRRESDWRDQLQEGLRLTTEKAKNFAMSVNILEPGSKIGPRVLRQDGTIWQQQTLRRSEDEVPVTRPAQIEPGAHYRLEIYPRDGSWRPRARLVKVEEPIQESKAMGYDSQLFQTVYPSLSALLRMKVIESKMRAVTLLTRSNIIFKNEFDEDLAKRSILTAINKLPCERRKELEEMCKTASATKNIPLGEKALGCFLLTLDRTDIGQLLQDQLEAAVGKDHYPALLATIYNDVYVRFIDIIESNAQKYVKET